MELSIECPWRLGFCTKRGRNEKFPQEERSELGASHLMGGSEAYPSTHRAASSRKVCPFPGLVLPLQIPIRSNLEAWGLQIAEPNASAGDRRHINHPSS